MKYKIVYDKPGRLRLRMGRSAFSAEQGYGIEELLLSESWGLAAEACCVNGGILIHYKLGCRNQVLSLLERLDKKNLPVSQKREANQLRELNDSFSYSLALVLCKHYMVKLLLPAPLRAILTVRRAFSYFGKGLRSLQKGKLGVDVLDGAAVMAATAQKDFKTAASIMTLLHISELLEDYTRKKAQQTLAQSLALHVDKAWLVGDEEDVFTSISEIRIDDRIRVHTGGVIPLDGEVTDGEAILNEASMTGESLGVLRKKGHSVYAGTVVEEGSLVIKVRTLADNTRIQNIVSLIDQSEALKAGVQSKAEKLADSIVPFSFLTSVATLILTRNITKAMSVLLVDYSCAIKLTTPICVISAMHQAANQKILVKGGKYLEACANADTVIFDKTGTLTAAYPKVAKVIPFGGLSRNEALKISACLEEHFPHSLAKAIVRQAEIENLQHREEHAEVEYVVAHGISSILHGKQVLIGSGHFVFDDMGIPVTEEEKTTISLDSEGYSTVFLSMGGRLAGMICVEDPVRQEAKHTLDALRKLGIKRIIMLTGDGESAAKAACKALSITEFHAQVLPEEKADIVRSLKNQGHTVMMVGDGINDSPALSCADVSIAMKDGADIAKEVADITLLGENLDDLLILRRLSMALFERINKNYRFILGFNTSLLLLGITGIVAPGTSAVLHNVSTMLLSGMSMQSYLTDYDGKEIG